MNKYIKAIFCIPLGVIKFGILKIEHRGNFRGLFPVVLSPLTEISVEKKAKLFIDKNLRMHNGAKIRVRQSGMVNIGKNFGMSNGCVVTSYNKIVIGDDVMLGPNVLIYDQDHDYSVKGGVKSKKYKTSPIKIGNNVWIGANSLILRGTVIEDDCIIAGGSVVKGRVEKQTLLIQKREQEIRKI